MRSFDEACIIRKCEDLQEYKKWAEELPYLHFKKEWKVKIIPPFGGTVIRFCISYKDKWVSVYFDGYSELGSMIDERGCCVPYFEYCDGEDFYRYPMDESDRMMNDIESFLES